MKVCIIEENSVDRHLDGNGVPELAYMGHIVWAACQSQRTTPLNRPCRRECTETKPTNWGVSIMSQYPSLIITHSVHFQTLLTETAAVLVASMYQYLCRSGIPDVTMD
jgi:hypothetical protein